MDTPYTPPVMIAPEPEDDRQEIDAIMRGLRQRLRAGWSEQQAVDDLVTRGADPELLYMCLVAVRILKETS